MDTRNNMDRRPRAHTRVVRCMRHPCRVASFRRRITRTKRIKSTTTTASINNYFKITSHVLQSLRDARLKLKKYTLRRESSFPNKQWYKERYRSCLNKNNKPKEPSFTSVPSIEEQQYLSPPTVKHKTRKQRKNYDLELTPQKEPGRRVMKKRDFYKP